MERGRPWRWASKVSGRASSWWWAKLPRLPGRASYDRLQAVQKPGDPSTTGRDNRRFVEAVLWIARTGAPWRDLPAEFGNWNSTWRRFDRWSARGVWERLFAAMADDPDFEYVIIDATIVRAHQHSAGGRKGLKLRPSGARAAVSRPSSTSPSTRSATLVASGSRPGSATR
jgi:putative transposase